MRAIPLLLLPALAAAGDLVDTRLVFVAGDDDFAHDAGSSVPPSQRFDLENRAGYTEFYDRRDSSETLYMGRTHLVVHKAAGGFFERVFTEAALVIELDHDRLVSGDPRGIHDDGTYLNLEYRGEAGTFAAVMMPFDSDRLRVGNLWDVTWGGASVFPGRSSAVPALKLEWRSEWYEIYGSAKTARLQLQTADVDRNGQLETFYAAFGGISGGRRDGGFRGTVEGGYVQKGLNPRDTVLGEPVDGGGLTVRVQYVDGLPFEPTNDTRLYSADPIKPWNHEDGRTGWRLGAEVTYLAQTLEDPDRTGGVELDEGYGGALYGSGKTGGVRLLGRFIYRDVSFLTFDFPGANTQYQALPEGTETTPELVAMFGYEHHVEDLHLRPGITLGYQQPASISSVVPDAGLYGFQTVTGRKTILLRRADMFDDSGLHLPLILPDGEDALPVFGARVHLQLDLAEGFGLLAQVTVLHDRNRILFDQDVLNVNDLKGFDTPTSVGAAILAVAEF